VYVTRINPSVQAATQNFSAGILIAAVAGELYPLLGARGTGTMVNVGMAVGFALGLVLMYGLKTMLESDDDDEEDGEDEGYALEAAVNPLTLKVNDPEATVIAVAEVVKTEMLQETKGIEQGLEEVKQLLGGDSRDDLDRALHVLAWHIDKANRRARGAGKMTADNAGRSRFHAEEASMQLDELKKAAQSGSVGEVVTQLRLLQGTVEHMHSHSERVESYSRWHIPDLVEKGTVKSEIVPWSLVAAVNVDSFVDGLLVGLAYTASAQAGYLMAFATCIEMGFLGLSFSATLQNITDSKLKHLAHSLAPSCVLLLGGLMGAAAGEQFQSSPAMFAGFISFAIVALLFLVTQELLAEAREAEVGDLWYINIWVFFGIFTVVLVEKAMEAVWDGAGHTGEH